MFSKYYYKKGSIILAMKQIYSIFRVTSTKVIPTLDTKQNEDTGNESSMFVVLFAIASVLLFLVVVAAVTGMYIHRRKRHAYQGNIS